MSTASLETTLALWASLLSGVKSRIRPLFTHEATDSHVPRESQMWSHAAFMPDAVCAVIGRAPLVPLRAIRA